MNIIDKITKELQVSSKVIDKVIELFTEGATVPFIARYRKELTGGLDEVQLVQIKDRHAYWTAFIKRKEAILKSIKEQGKLTPELLAKINQAQDSNSLEDLYLPYKQKRKSKGQIAIEQGLQPLAVFIQRNYDEKAIEEQAHRFLKNDITSSKVALAGAINILAEWIAETPRVRTRLRAQFKKRGTAFSKVKRGKKEAGIKYKDYFEFSEPIQRIPSHRVLALFRAEKEGFINFSVDVPDDYGVTVVEESLSTGYARNSFVNEAIEESFDRILQPNFESEIKKEIKEKADADSISVFAENLKQLLLQSPLGAKNVLAIDPGFRTGCKVVVLNKNGDFISNTTIYPHPPQNKTVESEKTIKHLISAHSIQAIAVGNGTAGLETEKFCRAICKQTDVQVFSVNEAGASIYSASEIARDEFPDLDLTVRGAISIGRRLIDPLQELVKIDAKSIGVGQYQHDVNQPMLKQKLTEVVEHSVNHVGVELNTASYPILAYVSGLGPTLAKNIVKFREENGNFTERKQLLKVPKMGKKTYEQAAGFLRIENGKNPLDNTIVHPESYHVATELAKANGKTVSQVLVNHEISSESIKRVKSNHSHYVVDFVVNELKKPTRDPRKPLKEMVTNNISCIEDLYEGMPLTGTVNNITNFGAFVNIGIKESGLVHISEISNTYVSNIHDVVKLNQAVNVKVKSVDIQRKRIQLTMKG